ncbi:hypothetical protein HanIR_Chr06g0269601 [Helianthus annuus]|nr:hypothetical protein HanIR_Chr06g0269601 [Helianthus annuus]KAJ0572902.1 hypothetical protein HanHA89_Chr06g0220881 [Helianthus annuus]
MNEIYCSTRLIRTNTTTSKKSAIFQEQYVAPKVRLLEEIKSQLYGC